MSGKPGKMRMNDLLVEKFNQKYPVGTFVRYWPGTRDGDFLTGTLKHPAEVLGGHTPVAWIEGARGCVALTHVEVLQAVTPLTARKYYAGEIANA